jgi:alginate O-acetyltransferase complex protein AlgI
MTSINLIFISLFILATILSTHFLPATNKWQGLLATCLLFYFLLIGEKITIVLLLAAVVYAFSHLVRSQKSMLWMGLVLLLIPLLIFKGSSIGHHFDAYRIQTSDPIDWSNSSSLFQIIGLSYFTFNAIGYLIDIKRNYISPEKNFFFLLLYLLYFPTIFSGPLHRVSYLFQEFRKIEITNHSLSNGLRLMLWGVFKNAVIAQRIFMLVLLFQNSEMGGPYYLIVGLLFFLYLYCNFSSFIDFFRGVSMLFGINLKNNFRNRVYLSSSRQQFWKGWHITLNEWFRDYFFFAVSKYDKKRRYIDILLLITFLLIALWHEFSIALVIWGFLNGLWIVTEKKFNFNKWSYPALRNIGGVLYHLSVASMLALIFISPNLSLLYQRIIIQPAQLPAHFFESYTVTILIAISCFGIMDYHYAKAKGSGFEEYVGKKPMPVRWLIYFKLVILILTFGTSGGVDNYYIQF